MPAALYDINKTYLENAEEGPFFFGKISERITNEPSTWTDFLGFKVATPIGVPAGPLLNARWINLAAKLGYDIVTYKTIRSTSFAGHGLPNVIFLENTEQLNPQALPNQLFQTTKPPNSIKNIAITNSFGMPSRSQEYLSNDIPLANSYLSKGQVMIVSIVGSSGAEDFITDFVATALAAKNFGAKIIEANFSCPNVKTGEGCLYYNPEAIQLISSKITKAIGDTPLVIKVGLFPNESIMRKAFIAAAKGGVRAIAGINTISMKVLNSEGKPALGEDRLTSGVCGAPIRNAALSFVRDARIINDQEKLGLTIIGGGGIMLPRHFTEFFEAGADAAMTATGMMWDPYLANKYSHNMQHVLLG